MKKKIVILAGGYSKEREISLNSGKEVYKSIKNKYRCYLIDPKGDLNQVLKKIKPDIVFNGLHGRYGEDGYIQSILENEKIKYTHSGVLSSFLAMDKYLSKKIFKENKILTPPSFKYTFSNNLSDKQLFSKAKKLRFPLVLKPINEGSSVGVYLTNSKNFFKNLNKLKSFKEILIEKYIPGREIQSAVLGNKKLGAIELIPKRKFYDYKAKYDKKANTIHVMPADLSKKNYNKVNNIALKAHKILNCSGVTRSDFRFYKNKFYLLELNTQPGMTSLSLVPEIAKYNNIEFNELIELLLKDASTSK